MSENSESSISKWQLLFRNHEQAIWQSDKASLRTLKVNGTKDENADPEILKSIAREITIWRSREYNHFNEKLRRKGMYSSTQTATTAPKFAADELNKQLEELIGATTETIVTRKEEPTSQGKVDPSHIDLYEINDDSRVITNVYPLSFHCFRCGHYEILDSKNQRDLTCPCCKEAYCFKCAKAVPFTSDNKCKICGQQTKRNELQQFSFVFACPRCAHVEELTPRLVQLRNVQGRRIPCQAGGQCTGHIHFVMRSSFLKSFWKCETCNDVKKVDKHCICHIAKVEDQNLTAIPSIMKPITTNASSIMRPLISSYLYMGTSTVTLEGLQQEHDRAKSIDLDSWSLKDDVENIDLQMIKDQYGISNAFTVPEITTLTIVYGYISGVQSFPTRIADNDRLAKLFKYGHKYRAYAVKTKGRGLIIVLDKEKILETLKKAGVSGFNDYKDLADKTKAAMTSGQLQTLVENPDQVPLISLLHGVEHALAKTLIDQTGLEEFGSKIMIDDCCIVLYERENLGSGGLTQITKSKQGSEFKKFLLASQKHLRMCSQLCERGCLACIFINDFHCQPYIPNEVGRWFPPNSILNRNLSREFFNVK